MNTILLLGGLQAIFLVFLLLSKSERSFADNILAFWLAHIGIHLMIYYLYGIQLLTNAYVININAVLPLMQGPYLYLYVRSLVVQSSRLKLLDLLHLLPAFCLVLYIFLLPSMGQQQSAELSVFDISTLLTVVILASVPIYIVLSFLRISHYNTALHNHLSSTRGVNLNWLRTILLGMSLLWIFLIGINVRALLAAPLPRHANNHSIFLLLTIFVYAIGYLGIRQRNIFTELLPPGTDLEFDSPAAQKYKRSGLKELEISQIAERLQQTMEREKPYLDDALTLQELARQLDLSVNSLSQVINQHFKQNFYEYVNSYRVREFIARQADPKNQNLTILALALDSGFSSKASFNRIFKKLTGTTPSQHTKA